MQINLLKIINRIFFIGLIITIPASSFGESAEDFPFHIGETIEKEMTYPYAFEEVWETALIVLKNIENITTKEMQGKGIKSFKTKIISDKSSRLITYFTTHKGQSGFFTATVLPTFTYQVLLVQPIENQRTRIYFHEINYIPYSGNVFEGKAFARRLYFAPSEGKILEEIQSRLNEKTYKNE